MKHGNALRRGLALVLSAAMAVSSAFAVDWEIDKSKDATELNDNVSTVTLSLPSDEYKPIVDVVLVVDVSSSMKDADIDEAKRAANAMLDELAAKNNVTVNIGIVTFDKEAHNLTNGLVSIDSARAAVDEIKVSEDTNMMAGLIAGKNLLDSGNADPASKYLVLMSDGIPIYWVENDETMCKTLIRYHKDKVTEISRGPAGSEPEGSYPDASSVMSIDELLSKTDVATDSNEWKQVSDTGEDFNPDCRYTNIQKSTYMTAEYLKEEILGQYKLKMIAFGTDKYKNNAVYTYGENFCDWIGEQSGVDYYKISKPGYGGSDGDLVKVFTEIANDLVYLVDDGSKVVDEMGHGTVTAKDGNTYDYHFEFNGIESVLLKINGEAVEIDPDLSDPENNSYTFVNSAGVHSILKIEKGDNTNTFDTLTWELKQPVLISEPVTLEYGVTLQGSILDAPDAVYGTYDADGSEGYPGLLTNYSAILTPVDSTDTQGEDEVFNRPTVSYTKGNGGSAVDPDPEPEPDPGNDNDKPSGGGDNDRYEGPDLTVVKVDEDGETIESNARFRIYKEQGSKTMWYKGNQSWSEDEEDAWIFNTSVGDGSFTAYDLKPGTYYIVEVSAPEGYDLAEEPLEVEVESRDVTVEFVNSGDGVVTTPTKPVPDTGR